MTKELAIQNRLGLHARPSAMFVKTCNRFRCEIWVEKDGERVNGKSIMGLMMLAAGLGSRLTSTFARDDEVSAMEEIEKLLDRKFEED